MESGFPPPLQIGSRVWTCGGYRDHGRLEGPKIDVAANMGGTVAAAGSPYGTISNLLYTIKWDNGQVSKHYSTGLFCIGRFDTLSEFVAAIQVLGPVELTIGPQGGFRHVKLKLDYDGTPQDVQLFDRGLWFGHIEAIAKNSGVEISTIQLPPKPRKKRSKR